MRSSIKRIASSAAVVGVAGIAGYALARRRLQNWGAAADEVSLQLPGDELVSDASYLSTRAVTVQAQPADIWPWLAQMGYRRGGLYSYDWLDRLFGYLDAPSAESVLSKFQNLTAGDRIPMGRGPSWPVRVADAGRALVLEPVPGKISWSFALLPVDGETTRLITRVRMSGPECARERLMLLLIDPAAFVMTRRMLLGIKQRAEALARARQTGLRPTVSREALASGSEMEVAAR